MTMAQKIWSSRWNINSHCHYFNEMMSSIESIKVQILPIIMTKCTPCLSFLSVKSAFYNSNPYFSPFITATLQIKGKLFPIHGTKAYRGSRGTARLILNYGTRWRRWLTSRTDCFKLGTHLIGGGGRGSRAGLDFRRRKRVSPPTGIWTPERPAPSVVRLATALPRHPVTCSLS
jgi:hypothetical protein